MTSKLPVKGKYGRFRVKFDNLKLVDTKKPDNQERAKSDSSEIGFDTSELIDIGGLCAERSDSLGYSKKEKEKFERQVTREVYNYLIDRTEFLSREIDQTEGERDKRQQIRHLNNTVSLILSYETIADKKNPTFNPRDAYNLSIRIINHEYSRKDLTLDAISKLRTGLYKLISKIAEDKSF